MAPSAGLTGACSVLDLEVQRLRLGESFFGLVACMGSRTWAVLPRGLIVSQPEQRPGSGYFLMQASLKQREAPPGQLGPNCKKPQE